MTKISVEEFIKGYFEAKAEDREDYIKSHITTYYIPYEEKLSICERIADVTTHKTVGTGDNAQRIYWDNTGARIMFVYLELINHYTDIEVSFKDGRYIKIYDQLNEHYTNNEQSTNLFEDLLYAIPRTEVELFINITKNLANDIRTNETNAVNYIDAKLQAVEVFFKSGFEKFGSIIGDALSQEGVMDEIKKLLETE